MPTNDKGVFEVVPGAFAANELFNELETGSPCVIVSEGGREFNMVVERCGSTFLFGHVAVNKTLVVYSIGDRPDLQVVVVNKPEDAAPANDPDASIVYCEPCLVGSSKRMSCNASKISITEEPWRKFIPSSIYDISHPPQNLDVKTLFPIFPALAQYYVQGVGLVKPNRIRGLNAPGNLSLVPPIDSKPGLDKTDDSESDE